ncbi:MAG: c-type cytochrome biogenesis protein CcmI [Alphaproteobacteria bacterium]
MMLWAIFAFMAALAVGLVLRPLLGRGKTIEDRSLFEAAVYRDQLANLDAEQTAQLIGEADAKAARVEIGRRLLAVHPVANGLAGGAAGSLKAHRALAMVVLALVPAISVATYLIQGSPDAPAVPFKARLENQLNSASLPNLVAQVEQHLRADPDDAQGWEIIGRPYMRLGRYNDAANAFNRAIALAGPSAQRLSSYGEALVFAASGMVEAKAREAFEKALALKADFFEPQYYLGLAAFQARDFDGAIATWQAMLDTGSADAPWRGEIGQQIVLAQQGRAGENAEAAQATPPVANAQPGPSAQDITAAQSMSPEQRRTMIETMVARLADRLADSGDDIDGWVRLVRAYGVLGRTDQAREALKRAREIFTGDPEKLGRLANLAPGSG